jgi:integrase
MMEGKTMAPTGEVTKTDRGWQVRIVIKWPLRKIFPLGFIEESEARERAGKMATMARQLRLAGHDIYIDSILQGAALGCLKKAETLVETLLKGVEKVAPPSMVPTFKDFAQAWTNGELAKRWPDHVAQKSSSDVDEMRLAKHVYPVIGHVRMDKFTLEHAETVMGQIDSTLSPASRRHIAQLVSHVVTLAVYPAKHLAVSPIPKGWLPSPGTRKAMSCLYPSEDSALIACSSVPLSRRVLYGFLAREGMRKSEATTLLWTDLDLERGLVKLDENKTDEPRIWSLDPGVTKALKAWRKLNDSELVFPIDDAAHLAGQFREDLQAAGITRPELFERSSSRLPIRAHDLRSTFITVSLANGKSETWVADRTGHRSSQMIHAYKRQARTWTEANLGSLAPLDSIPELVSEA